MGLVCYVGGKLLRSKLPGIEGAAVEHGGGVHSLRAALLHGRQLPNHPAAEAQSHRSAFFLSLL